jgi:hypothetical protein
MFGRESRFADHRSVKALKPFAQHWSVVLLTQTSRDVHPALSNDLH